MDDSSTPPLEACLYISLIVSCCQLAFSLSWQSLLTILRALVGHSETQRWQSTHLDSSLIIFPRSGMKICTSFAHCLSQTRQAMQRS